AAQRQPRPDGRTEGDWRLAQWKKTFARLEEWLDMGPANRCLGDADLADEVVRSMYHFAGVRYDLISYVVMPSHVHWVFHPRPDWETAVRAKGRTPREMVVYSFKRFTANACNRR